MSTGPVATFRPVAGGYAAMYIDGGRVLTMLTRAELLELAADATATANQITAPTPAQTVGHLPKRTP